MKNPLIPGFHPDPSIVRVGEDYYLATSTFEYLPGIPIYHSRDLEKFDLVGHVITRSEQTAVPGVPTNGGVWAPTLRYHDDRFWLVVPEFEGSGRGNILYSSERPEGPWDDGVVMDVFGIDPDIAWDADDRCYVTMSGLGFNESGKSVHLGITQTEFDPLTGRSLEEPRRLWSGTGGMFPEAPHLHERDGWWYLMIAEGGTERGHAVTIARSRSPRGPFVPAPRNPLLTARGSDRPVQNTGHGDLVSTPSGEWAMIVLGTRPRSTTRAFAPLGRETFIVQVTWTADGWPVAAPVHLDSRHNPISLDLAFPSHETNALDGFDGEIVAVRQFPRDVADLSARPGAARLTGRGGGMADLLPAFFGIRQITEGCTLTVDLDVCDGVGGLAVRYDERFHLDVETDGTTVTASMHLPTLHQSWNHKLVTPAAELSLRVRADPGTAGLFELGVSCDALIAEVRDGNNWVAIATVDGRYLSCEVAESFTGRVWGAYARDGIVDVLRFRYDGQDIERPHYANWPKSYDEMVDA